MNMTGIQSWFSSKKSAQTAAATTTQTSTTTTMVATEKKEGLLSSRRISAVYETQVQASTAGNLTVRILAIACGLGLIAASALLFTNWIVKHYFSFLELVILIIAIGVAILAIILESNFSYFDDMKTKLITKVPMFGQVTGRGSLYTAVGLLQCAVLHSPLHILVGLFTCVVGLYMINVGQKANATLNKLKTSITDEKALLLAFQKNDRNGDGVLEMFEFDGLLLALGVELDSDELDAAFYSIDTNNDKKIVYDEFRTWWKACTAEAESDGVIV